MNEPRVISVNPLSSTLGERIQESRRYAPVVKKIVTSISTVPRLKSTLNFLTGINARTMIGASSRILLLRLLTGASLSALSWLAYTSGIGAEGAGLGFICMAGILGASLLFGFMTRIISTASICFVAAMAFEANVPLPIAAFMGFVALVFAILGPGVFSTDQCLRKAIFRSSKRIAAHQRRNSLNYKSYLRV